MENLFIQCFGYFGLKDKQLVLHYKNVLFLLLSNIIFFFFFQNFKRMLFTALKEYLFHDFEYHIVLII